jgi:hypothetical protein
MVEGNEFISYCLTHRHHFTGRGVKSPKGALVKSQGIERLGESIP